MYGCSWFSIYIFESQTNKVVAKKYAEFNYSSE